MLERQSDSVVGVPIPCPRERSLSFLRRANPTDRGVTALPIEDESEDDYMSERRAAKVGITNRLVGDSCTRDDRSRRQTVRKARDYGIGLPGVGSGSRGPSHSQIPRYRRQMRPTLRVDCERLAHPNP